MPSTSLQPTWQNGDDDDDNNQDDSNRNVSVFLLVGSVICNNFLTGLSIVSQTGNRPGDDDDDDGGERIPTASLHPSFSLAPSWSPSSSPSAGPSATPSESLIPSTSFEPTGKKGGDDDDDDDDDAGDTGKKGSDDDTDRNVSCFFGMLHFL
jgi:hypothetical protein